MYKDVNIYMAQFSLGYFQVTKAECLHTKGGTDLKMTVDEAPLRLALRDEDFNVTKRLSHFCN